jgi:hypothetical protein
MANIVFLSRLHQEKAFRDKAVSLPSPPNHQEFRKILSAPGLADSRVFLGVLADLRATGLAIAEKEPEQP